MAAMRTVIRVAEAVDRYSKILSPGRLTLPDAFTPERSGVFGCCEFPMEATELAMTGSPALVTCSSAGGRLLAIRAVPLKLKGEDWINHGPVF